jgi:hypothetical protein
MDTPEPKCNRGEPTSGSQLFTMVVAVHDVVTRWFAAAQSGGPRLEGKLTLREPLPRQRRPTASHACHAQLLSNATYYWFTAPGLYPSSARFD